MTMKINKKTESQGKFSKFWKSNILQMTKIFPDEIIPDKKTSTFKSL